MSEPEAKVPEPNVIGIDLAASPNMAAISFGGDVWVRADHPHHEAIYNRALSDAKRAIQRLIESTRQPPEHSFHVMAAAIEKRTVLASAIAVIDELHKPVGEREKDAVE